MQQSAYDFALFEDHSAAGVPQQKRGAPIMVAVAGGKAKESKVKKHVVNVWIVLMVAALLSLTILLVQSKATLTELNTQVREVQREITDAKSQYNYLSSELGKRTGMARIEDIAKQQGLMKVNDSQITYVRLEENSVITGGETEVSRMAELIQAGLLSILNALDP